jgi:hypothetical protein
MKKSNKDKEPLKNTIEALKEKTPYILRKVASNAVLDSKFAQNGASKKRLRFARVPSGAVTCAFCCLLASRGFVYLTKESAGELSRFHYHCDCVIVANTNKSVSGYDPDALYKHKLKDIVEIKSKDGKVSYEWRAGTDSAKDYDFDRYCTIPEGVVLTDAEFEFARDFACKERQITFIPVDTDRKNAKPTNDFIWKNNGEWELKSPNGNSYGNIMKAIVNGIRKGKTQIVLDVTKSETELAKIKQYASYFLNLKRNKGAVERLGIFYKGEFHEITKKDKIKG